MRARRAAAAALGLVVAACAAPPEAKPRVPIVSTVVIGPASPTEPYDLSDVTAERGAPAARVWRFEKNGLRLSVFGLMHRTERGARWLSPAARSDLEAADLVLTEVGTTNAGQYNPQPDEIAAITHLLTRQDGGDTRDLAAAPGTHERAMLDAALELARIPPSAAARVQPWTICLDFFHGPKPDTGHRLSREVRALAEAAAKAIGPLDQETADARIERARVSRGLAHGALETLVTRARIYGTMAEEEALACIRTLSRRMATGDDYRTVPERFARMRARWMSGDAETARVEEVAMATAISPAFAARLFQARERAWLALIAERCEAGALNCAVAVGFAHLGGADGLLKGLEAMGWRRVRESG